MAEGMSLHICKLLSMSIYYLKNLYFGVHEATHYNEILSLPHCLPLLLDQVRKQQHYILAI